MNNQKAFTLIELLVVVLIIGILAAVALPQYQKAVEKSRATQALIILKTAYDAAKAYQLANGYWPTDFDELSVDIPWTGTENWQKPGEVRPGRSNGEWSIQFQRGSTGEGNAISIGRLKGKYQGAGFYISSTPEDPLPKDEIFCVEYRNTNYSINPFTQGTGSYCNKIFKAKRIQTSHNGSMDYFRMP